MVLNRIPSRWNDACSVPRCFGLLACTHRDRCHIIRERQLLPMIVVLITLGIIQRATQPTQPCLRMLWKKKNGRWAGEQADMSKFTLLVVVVVSWLDSAAQCKLGICQRTGDSGRPGLVWNRSGLCKFEWRRPVVDTLSAPDLHHCRHSST